MSMNKMFKKVLAVVAAGAMTMGMAMPTFAAEGGKVTEAYVSKTYNTEVGKAEKFSFTATQVKAGTGIITTAANVTIPDISFTAEQTGTTKQRAKVNFVINGAAQDTVTASKYDEAITVSEKSLGQKKNTVDVTNTYNYVPTTGIIMNTLPYVLMIALCGVALIAFVGFKRRRLQK